MKTKKEENGYDITYFVKFIGLLSLILSFGFAFFNPLKAVAFALIYFLAGLSDININTTIGGTQTHIHK